MTSRFVWLFLFILLDTSIDWTQSMNFHRILLTAGGQRLDRVVRDRRNVDKSFDSLQIKDTDKVGLANDSDTENVTVRSNMTAANVIDYVIISPTEEKDDAPTHLKECNPCVLWKPAKEDDSNDTQYLNLTIIPMGGIFMFLTGLVFSFISWCTEDLHQDDERFMKITVPLYLSPTGSPEGTPAKHHPPLRGVHHHRRSSISVSHTRCIQKARIHLEEGIPSNIDETTSEENTVIYSDVGKKPAPAAAAAASRSISKRMSQKMGLNRSPNRYLRRQSLNSSNTTLSSAFSSRSPSVRKRNISFQNSQESTSPSSLSYTQGDSYFDITPLIRHSTSSETPFSQRKMSFHTHLLSPPLLHFQVSSMNTSTTSLGESIPSVNSKPSVCESVMTEQMCISEDNESCGSEGACSSSRLLRQSSHKSGMMFLSGSYYEDPLILQCSYMEVDETVGPSSEPAVFTCGSRSPSPESVNGETDPSAQQQCGGEPSRTDCTQDTDSHSEDGDTQIDLLEGSDLSDCNSETGLTENQDGEEEFPKGSESTSYCSSPGAYRGMDPSLYYKLSVDSNASTGSLQSPESMQSDSNSVCSSEVALLRRVNPSVTMRSLNPKSHTPRRERVSLNGVTYLSQHGGRRIQNGKVMRMCRSWCLGDKVSAVYGQYRRGQLEKECYM